MARNVVPSQLSRQIAAILRAQVAKFQLTQVDVAANSGISQSQLSKVLRGTRVLDVDQLDALCQTLGLEIADVVADAYREVLDLDDAYEWLPQLVDGGRRVEASAAVVTNIFSDERVAAFKAPDRWREETDQ